MNYQPNPHAQRLVTGRFEKMAAIFTLSLDLNVGTKKLQFLQYFLSNAGFEVPIYACGDRSQDAAQSHLMNMLCLQRPRAIVCNTSGLLPETMQILQRYREEGGYVVCYDEPIDLECDKVVFDREDNTYQVIRHLLEMGHREIALAEFGLEPNPDWMLGVEASPNAEPFSDVYEENGALMAQRFLQLNARPSAVCLLDDYTSVAFAAELERYGVKVPADVSVVSHDDSPIAVYGPLQLTTVTHPVRAIAQGAIDLLKQRVQEPESPPRQITVRGDLIVRASAIPFARA
jgi:DNA-binding LacI/PurR family transcriptional regulator